MKIPWEVPMFYLSESDISAAEGVRAEPVLSSSKLGSNLSGQTTAYSRNPAHGDPVSTTAPWSVANEERRKQQSTDENLKNRAYQMIYNRRFAEEVQVWLDELRDEAYINIISGQKN